MNKEELRNLIFNTISDNISKFLYYDRKEDEDLPVEKIEESINKHIITVDEICKCFEDNLRENLPEIGSVNE